MTERTERSWESMALAAIGGLPDARIGGIKHRYGTNASETAFYLDPGRARGAGHHRAGSMTILITGGGGYIGSHMVHTLADAGEAVVVIDNLATGFRSALPKSATVVVGDVGDEALVAEVITSHAVTEIIHFAASVVVPDSVREPLSYYRNNTMNTRALLDVAVKTGVRHFIFSSTAAVYGNPARVPVAETAAPG